MTKTELKEKARQELLYATQAAFNAIEDQYSGQELEEIREEASKQMARIEKMFGYEEYSWTRGV